MRVDGVHILIAICYRVPHLGFLADFDQILVDIMATYRTIVMGDFNIMIYLQDHKTMTKSACIHYFTLAT